MYASGVWIVKQGREEEFARVWQRAADESAMAFPGVTFRLLRDAEDAQRFVAFSGPWRSAEQIAAARDLPAFQELVSATGDLVESSELYVYDLAAEVS